MIVVCDQCGQRVRSHRTTGNNTAVTFDIKAHPSGRWRLEGHTARRDAAGYGLRIHPCWKEKHATR